MAHTQPIYLYKNTLFGRLDLLRESASLSQSKPNFSQKFKRNFPDFALTSCIILYRYDVCYRPHRLLLAQQLPKDTVLYWLFFLNQPK